MTVHSKLLTSAAVALAAAAWTAPAQAAPTIPLYSGGGTLAEKVYRDIMNCYGDHSGSDTTVGLNPNAAIATCSSATPYRAAVQLLYAGVGSGNGKKAFFRHDAQELTKPDYLTGTPGATRLPDSVPVPSTSDFGPFYGTGTGAGWAAGKALTPAFPKVSFVGSDDPLTSSDITAYNANSTGWGKPIQVPGMITVIAVPYKALPGVGAWVEKGKAIAGNTSKLNITTKVLCGIFSGAINDWSDAEIKAMNGNVTLGTGQIKVKYRGDSSGSTFLFSNALVNQCASTSHPLPADWVTANGGKGDNSFFIKANASATPLPANFTPASGSGGMQAAINTNDGSIGYISPDFINIKNVGGVVIDPTGPLAANLQTFASLSLAAPVFKAPTGKNGTPIMAAAKPPSFAANCATLAQGCATDALKWGVTNPAPISAGAYPIGGFTFIDTYTCFASATDADAVAGATVGSLGYLRYFFGSPTDNGSKVKNSLLANGFSLVPGGWISAAKTLISGNKTTKIGIPGQINTGCKLVTGTGA